MKNINFNVSQDTIEKLSEDVIISDSYNYVCLIFNFDSSWSQYNVKKATFFSDYEDGEEKYEADIVNNVCVVPFEILKKSKFKDSFFIGVYGQVIEDEILKQRNTTNMISFKLRQGSYFANALNPGEIEPSAYDLYLAKLNEVFEKGLNEYNKNADEKIKEINNKVTDIEKIEDNIEQIQKNVQASEQNAKDSEISAQNSAKKSSESEINIISIEKNINDLKKDIDNTKTQIDEKAKEVKNNSDIAIEQAKVATEQATLSSQNANKTSADKTSVETMRNEVSSMKTSVEQTKTDTEKIKADTQAIKDDTEALKEETLQAKEDVENSLENERIESDKRYAKAIDSDMVSINEFGQVECDNGGYMKDIEIESTLPEITQDTREGYNKFNIEAISSGGIEIETGKILANNSWRTSEYIAVKELTEYLFSWQSDNNFFQISYAFYDENKNFISAIKYEKHDIRSLIIETVANTKYIRIAYSVRVNGIDVIRDNIQLIEGTEEKPYEEYGASPSLNYPSEFKNLKNELSITNNQENYFNTTQIANKNFSTNGLSVSTDENGIFTVNGTHSEQVNIDFSNLDFKLRSGQKFKLINIDGQSDVSSNIIDTLRVLVWDKDFNDVGQVNSSINKIEGGTVNRARVRFLIPSNKTSVKYNNFKFGIMVVDDESVENYVPYNGYSKQITLPENKFLGTFNSYKNYIKDNKLKINLKIVEFDGTENWTEDISENCFGIYNISTLILSNSNQICTHFKTYNAYAQNINSFGVGSDYIRVHNDNNMSLEEWKSFLAQQKEAGTPLQILYISNEEETSLENINLLLYKGINNISAEDLKVSFKYNVSIEKYIEENNVNERKISDNKYARALKAQVEDVQQTQIYAENDEVENLIVKGAELTQKTREGYNLLNLEKYSYSENQSILNGGTASIKNGILNIDATNATDNMTVKSKSVSVENRDVLPAGEYYFGVNTNGYYESEQDTLVQFAEGIVTLTENYYLSQWYATCKKNEITNKKLLLSNDSSKTDYEQYGSSPSLDFPSEVEVAKQQNISINGKNKCRGWMNTTSTVIYGVAFLIKADLKPNTKYTISFLTPSFEAEYYRAEELTSNWFTVTNNGKRQSFTFTTKADISNAYKKYNGEYGYLLLKNTIATPSPANFSDVMLVEGDTDLPYEPYYGTNITIPLVNSAIGQYTDTIDRENSVQNKFIQELTLTGSESDWGREDTSVGTRFFKPLKNSIIANATSNESALCSHFKLALEGETYNNIKNLFAIYNVGSTNRIGFGSFTDISTVDEWKAKLKELYEAGTPVKIYYVAETSTPEPLSEEVKQELDKFKLYDGLNNISIDNGTLSFKYNKSLLKVLEEKDEKIDDLQSQIDEIKALLSSSSTASLLLENLANDNESEVS